MAFDSKISLIVDREDMTSDEFFSMTIFNQPFNFLWNDKVCEFFYENENKQNN